MRASGFRSPWSLPSRRGEVSTKLGLSAEFAQHFPNLVDGGIQVVIDVDKGVRPEPLLQFLPRQNSGYWFYVCFILRVPPVRHQRPNQATTSRPIWTIGLTD